MDEAIWVIIGVISIILMFGIIGTVVYNSYEDSKYNAATQGASSLSTLCTRVCRMPDETYLSSKIQIPGGSIIQTSNDRICINYKDKASCERCECQLTNYQLDLSNSSLFSMREYECFFLNQKSTLTMSCVG